MNHTEHDPRDKQTFVIRKLDQGFEVFAPRYPRDRFQVSSSNGDLACSCDEYRDHARCQHTQAVAERSQDGVSQTRHREEAAAPEPARRSQGQMILKRSVSPDGRIDALSVEITAPIVDRRDLAAEAESVLRIQSRIVEGFLKRNRTTAAPQAEAATTRPTVDSGACDAELLNIAGIDTRYGRRLFVNVRCNGSVLKLFGSEKRLAEAIHDAGFPEATEFIEEGIELNLPCRVTTKPTDDGRYINVESVYPASGNGRQA